MVVFFCCCINQLIHLTKSPSFVFNNNNQKRTKILVLFVIEERPLFICLHLCLLYTSFSLTNMDLFVDIFVLLFFLQLKNNKIKRMAKKKKKKPSRLINRSCNAPLYELKLTVWWWWCADENRVLKRDRERKTKNFSTQLFFL